jgi:hypothetical protein
MKVVINKCYGGFSLSEKAIRRGRELGAQWAVDCTLKGEKYPSGEVNDWSMDMYHPSYDDKPSFRADPLLIQVVQELGAEADGSCAELQVTVIPDGIDFEIQEYDGIEWVAEVHRTWG